MIKVPSNPDQTTLSLSFPALLAFIASSVCTDKISHLSFHQPLLQNLCLALNHSDHVGL